jgi:hypothetical protein
MWHWDQGRLPYFQFDVLRRISVYVASHNFKAATHQELRDEIGLSFAPLDYSPWRNYSRVLKLCLLVSEDAGIARPTPVAQLLSNPGLVTCDEYLHFLARAFTEPSPALQGWVPNRAFRYPLLLTLKYLLAKRAISHDPVSTLDEIIGAFRQTGFVGDETDAQFAVIIGSEEQYGDAGRASPDNLRRQARESLKVISQISYMHLEASNVIVSLAADDAHSIFADLLPVTGPREPDRESELRRLAELFRDGANEDFYDYPNTVEDDAVRSGFLEGSKVKRTHITIERNQGLRAAYFAAHDTRLCDVCSLDTAATYPWTERVLDLHHLLPLCSGTRVEERGTTFEDLVPVCPSCHRAVHRFYDRWLNSEGLRDFSSEQQARFVYRELKGQFRGAIHV